MYRQVDVEGGGGALPQRRLDPPLVNIALRRVEEPGVVCPAAQWG